jgi:hypothetical protein
MLIVLQLLHVFLIKNSFAIFPPTQTGYGYMAYLEAVKNGANGVECSLGFPDGAGQVPRRCL